MVGRAFQQFVRTEAASGVGLLVAASTALVLANSPLAASYEAIWQTPIGIAIGAHGLTLSARGWINDGLMAVFFLLVGLEIKRECLVGELSSPRLAALPIAGAVGGMIVPAAVFLAFTADTPAARGWAIPMATDIAFALGTLALVAPQAPVAVKVFLAALAIVDDLGAVVVIAVFYSEEIAIPAVAGVALTLVVLIAFNRLRVSRLTPYLLGGIPLWWFVHESGVHATIAGVLLAMTVPSRNPINAAQFSREARTLLDEFDRAETGDYLVLTSKGQQNAIFALASSSVAVTAPLVRLERLLHRVSALGIMPLFALANAGVGITSSVSDLGLMTGVVLGLAVGKPLGIVASAWLATRIGVASIPPSMSWAEIHACAWLGGIGFTMSIFIATLAFGGTPLLDAAKSGVIAGSLVAGVIGAILFRRARPIAPLGATG